MPILSAIWLWRGVEIGALNGTNSDLLGFDRVTFSLALFQEQIYGECHASFCASSASRQAR